MNYIQQKKNIERIKAFSAKVVSVFDQGELIKLQLILRKNFNQDNFFSASLSFPIISSISSFLQVPTLNLYQGEFLSAPKA